MADSKPTGAAPSPGLPNLSPPRDQRQRADRLAKVTSRHSLCRPAQQGSCKRSSSTLRVITGLLASSALAPVFVGHSVGTPPRLTNKPRAQSYEL